MKRNVMDKFNYKPLAFIKVSFIFITIEYLKIGTYNPYIPSNCS